MEDNMKGLWNNENKIQTKSKRNIKINDFREATNISSKENKINEKKLKKEIMTDIKKDYQAQGSSKIRISINHRKMIKITWTVLGAKNLFKYYCLKDNLFNINQWGCMNINWYLKVLHLFMKI